MLHFLSAINIGLIQGQWWLCLSSWWLRWNKQAGMNKQDLVCKWSLFLFPLLCHLIHKTDMVGIRPFQQLHSVQKLCCMQECWANPLRASGGCLETLGLNLLHWGDICHCFQWGLDHNLGFQDAFFFFSFVFSLFSKFVFLSSFVCVCIPYCVALFHIVCNMSNMARAVMKFRMTVCCFFSSENK